MDVSADESTLTTNETMASKKSRSELETQATEDNADENGTYRATGTCVGMLLGMTVGQTILAIWQRGLALACA